MASAIQIVVPTVVVFLMAVVGMGLHTRDFEPVLRAPRVIVLGTLVQITILPLAAVVIALALGPPAFLATGMVIVAACPPAAVVNLFVALAGWNTALSVALTAVGTLLAPLVLPTVLAAAATLGVGDLGGQDLHLGTMSAQIFATMLLPLALGMWLRHVRPEWCLERLPWLRRAGVVGIVSVALLVGSAGAAALIRDAAWFLALATVFVVALMLVGFLTGAALRLDGDDVRTFVLNSGIRNGGIAIFIATSVLQSVEIAVFPVGILLVQVPAGLTAAWWATRAVETAG